MRATARMAVNASTVMIRITAAVAAIATPPIWNSTLSKLL
jgi:hypothetical protein